MNRTKKLRGGEDLTKLEQLSLTSVLGIGAIVRESLNKLRTIIRKYYTTKQINGDENDKLDKLVASNFNSYINIVGDEFKSQFKDKKTLNSSIVAAIGVKVLEKHYNNVKGEATTLLKSINSNKSKTPSSVPVVPEPAIVEPANEESKIIGNLLAEIDILKSELVSKDITLEEKNREIVTAFSLLANGEKTKEELTREISASIEAQYNMQLKTITEELQQVKDKHKQKTEQYSITQYETRIEQMTKKFEEMEDKLHILADEKEALTIKHTQLQNDYITEQEKNEKLKKDYIAEQEKNKLIQTLFNDEQAKTKSLEIDLGSLTNNNKLKETIIEGLQVNLDKITKENEELTKNLGLKDADNARLIAELDALKSSGKTNKNATEKTVSEQEARIVGINAELDAVKKQLVEEQEKNKALISEQANNRSEIDKLTQNINAEEASKQVLNAELEKLKTEKQLLDDKNKQLDDLYKILIKDGGEKDKLYKTLQEERDKLIIKIDELEKELKERNEKNEALQQGINEIASKVGNSEGELTKSNDKIKALEAELKGLTEKHVELETEIKGLTEKNVALEKSLQGVTATNAELTATNAELTAQLQAKTKEASDLLERVGTNDRVASVDDLALALGNNPKSSEELKLDIDRLKEENAGLISEIGKLTSENSRLTKENETLKATINQDARTALSVSTASDATPQTVSTSGSVDPGRAFKQIDPKTIMRYTIFKDLEFLIQNIKKREIPTIISSLNDIIETVNELYPDSKLVKLSQNSKVKDINGIIVKIYQIIKPK